MNSHLNLNLIQIGPTPLPSSRDNLSHNFSDLAEKPPWDHDIWC